MKTFDVVFTMLYITVFGLAVFFVVRRTIKAESLEPKQAVGLGAKAVLLIFGAAVMSRIVLLLFCWGATYVVGEGNTILGTWCQWDANQYLDIANNGYYSEEGWIKIVFYPLYSTVVAVCKLVVGDARAAALLVSWVSLGGACVYLYKLVLLDHDSSTAKRAVKFLLIFPVTVFLGAPFTESMFLLLSLACLYYARIRCFPASCVLGGLAALTRNVGVVLAVPVFIEMLYAHQLVPRCWKSDLLQKLKRFGKDAGWLLLIPLGTAAYLLINHLILGDAFGFLQIQCDHWRQCFGSYANTLSVTWNAIAYTGDVMDKFTLWISQFIVLIGGGITLPLLCKKMRASYGAYAIVYLFIVFAPTWLLSGFRYYMGLAVLYPALAMLTRHKWVDIALTLVFILLVPIYSVVFSMGWLVF